MPKKITEADLRRLCDAYLDALRRAEEAGDAFERASLSLSPDRRQSGAWLRAYMRARQADQVV
jgi:hypothetical protein